MKTKAGLVRRAAGLNVHSLMSRGILALIGLSLVVFLVLPGDLASSRAQNSSPIDDTQPLSPGVGDGVPDNTFGTGGKVFTSFNTTGNRENRAFDGALQPDGKIIAVGFAHADGANNGGHDFAVARYNADGTPDVGFGPLGQRLVHFDQAIAGAADDAFAVALQTDNKVIVAGSAGITVNVGSGSQALCPRSWALARFNTDGTLDSTFGTNGNGRVQTPYLGPTPPFPAPCPDTNTITDIAIQPDGKVIAVGWASESTGENMLIGRYNTNGALDSTFGPGGFKVIDFFAVNTTDRLEAVALQSDGKIVAVGSARTASSPFDFAVVRLNSDGSPDNTFGTSGRASFSFSTTFDEHAAAVIVLPDGRIIVAGTSLINFNTQTFTLLRLTSGGVLDTTFGTNGRTVQQIGSGTSFCTSVALQHDGKLVAFGNAETNVREFALARYTVGGLLDSTFGTGGVVITDMAGPNASPDTIESGMIQPDGKIVGVGTVNGTQLPNFAHFGVARYGNTAPTTTHTISGTVTGAFNVSVALTGSQSRTTLTDRFGFYSFRSVPAGGSYTVTPTKSGTTFNPSSRTFNNLSSNQIAADFAATSSTLVIKGTIRDSAGIGIGDLTVNLTGSASLQTTTDSAGQYAFPGLVAGSYTVTPAATPNFNFNPANRVFNSVNNDQTGDFAATTNLPPATNGRIVFDGNSAADINTVNPDGSGLAKIGSDLSGGFSPAWSPDGKKIAISSNRTGVIGIYVMNPDGSNQTRVSSAVTFDAFPAWSPDGSKIAFGRYTGSGLAIFTMNADGSNPTRISAATNLRLYDFLGDWSPDGSKIVFMRVPGGSSSTTYQIFVMNADGSNETQLTTGPTYSQSPKWSPDGSKIVFTRPVLGINKIFVMNANGSNVTQLTNSSFSYAVPDWSPDGSKIVFQRGNELSTMNADGSNPIGIAKVSTAYGPSWGPQAAIATPTGANVNAQLGNVTVTYTNVNTAGTTTINPIDPTSVQPLPAGYVTIAGTGMAYNITTTATVTPPITTCFKVPSITNQTVFDSLRILHGEGGALVDRTILPPSTPAPDFATKTICASTTTLSPFIIAQKIDPNLLTIQGLVVDSNNLPLSEVTVTLGGDQTLTTQTDIDGRFLFVNLFVGSDYTVTPSSGGFNFIPQNKSFQDLLLDQAEVFVGSTVPPPPPGRLSLTAGDISVSESAGVVEIPVFNFGGNPGSINVNYSSSDTAGSNGCSVINGAASSRCDYSTSVGTLNFAAGETIKTISVLIIDDSYADGTETLTLQLSNPTGALLQSPSSITVTITDNDGATGANPIDQAQFYVDEHYVDFLGRLSDPGGRAFWTNEITSCGSNQACLEVKRINVSAAFFLSIEFQETGYFLERAYKSSFGDANGTSTLGGAHQLPVPIIRLNEFLADKQIVGRGLIVGQAGWEQVLENNKQAFMNEFVQRSRFTTAFPSSMTAAQFVDALNANAGNPLSQSERDQLVNDLATSGKTRAQVLRAVVEDAQLVAAEFNRAFVLVQYFGYLRRNPNDTPDSDYTGYDFWLTKLNQFGGNFVNAEMVKAFILSGEYRQRFGP